MRTHLNREAAIARLHKGDADISHLTGKSDLVIVDPGRRSKTSLPSAGEMLLGAATPSRETLSQSSSDIMSDSDHNQM